MAQCGYLYASGLRFQEGDGVVDLDGERLVVVRDGRGRVEREKPRLHPPADGEITLKQLRRELQARGTAAIPVTVYTSKDASETFTTVLAPYAAVGRRGRQDGAAMALAMMDPDEQQTAALYQVRTLPYSDRSGRAATEARLRTALDILGPEWQLHFDALPEGFGLFASDETFARAVGLAPIEDVLRFAPSRLRGTVGRGSAAERAAERAAALITPAGLCASYPSLRFVVQPSGVHGQVDRKEYEDLSSTLPNALRMLQHPELAVAAAALTGRVGEYAEVVALMNAVLQKAEGGDHAAPVGGTARRIAEAARNVSAVAKELDRLRSSRNLDETGDPATIVRLRELAREARDATIAAHAARTDAHAVGLASWAPDEYGRPLADTALLDAGATYSLIVKAIVGCTGPSYKVLPHLTGAGRLGLTDHDSRWPLMHAVLGADEGGAEIPVPAVAVEPGAAAMIGIRRSDGRYLVVSTKKNPTRFQPVGGGVEPGESPHLAAVRELREETGLTVRPRDLELAFRSAMDRRPGDIDMFVMDLPDGEYVSLQEEEIGEARWILPEEAEELQMFRTSKRFFQSLR